MGFSRDWDLLALPSIPYTLLGVYLLITYLPNKEMLKSVGLTICTVSLLHTSLWILINSDFDKSISRFKMLLATDTIKTKHYAYEDLANFFTERRMYKEAKTAFDNAIDAVPKSIAEAIIAEAKGVTA